MHGEAVFAATSLEGWGSGFYKHKCMLVYWDRTLSQQKRLWGGQSCNVDSLMRESYTATAGANIVKLVRLVASSLAESQMQCAKIAQCATHTSSGL
jgi:hypothetical protein